MSEHGSLTRKLPTFLFLISPFEGLTAHTEFMLPKARILWGLRLPWLSLTLGVRIVSKNTGLSFGGVTVRLTGMFLARREGERSEAPKEPRGRRGVSPRC
jgi:hypothetical protein